MDRFLIHLKASVDTDLMYPSGASLLFDGRTVPPHRPHALQTHTFYFEVLFEAGTEMCDTMCEADVDYQEDTCRRRGGRHR